MTKNKSSSRNPVSPVCAVIGAGSWGTALARLLAEKATCTSLWGHRQEHIEKLARDRQNSKYLDGFTFPEALTVCTSLAEAVRDALIICMVVPSHVYRETFTRILNEMPRSGERPPVYISATKGIENDSMKTMNQIMQECLVEHERSGTTAVLSGPSFAREVALKVPTAITIGSDDEPTAKYLQNLFSTDYFRVYTSQDVIGLEISAALKNIIAIAAGICDGLEFGSNARAALITRGLAEMTRLGKLMGAEEKTFYGLSGLGDLVLTCTGALSRNRHVGLELGKGKKIEAILSGMSMVAEGVKTTKSVYDLTRNLKIEMPILEQVYQIIYQNKDSATAVRDLLNRDLREE
ncbi:MAG: NAD(P)-dependent glycerol-3-phosphate dehydrogenase [Desulfofustis sp.]|nr:NAD(P)-dependent glycerol-3-phosphate dehydrogenase [Desulfofustis sp.]